MVGEVFILQFFFCSYSSVVILQYSSVQLFFCTAILLLFNFVFSVLSVKSKLLDLMDFGVFYIKNQISRVQTLHCLYLHLFFEKGKTTIATGVEIKMCLTSEILMTCTFRYDVILNGIVPQTCEQRLRMFCMSPAPFSQIICIGLKSVSVIN